MSYERRRRVYDLFANAVLTHGVPHYQNGVAGIPIKQDNPKTLDPLSTRTQIQVGVKYVLRTVGECEVADTGISAGAVGDPVYINKTTDALSLTPSAGANVPLGRIMSQGGSTGSPNANAFGTPTTKTRINMDARDSIAIP
jgi:hypothetical protein